MDPDANLARQLELANLVIDPDLSHRVTGAFIDQAEELAELVLALHEWLARGGFKPKAWGSAIATSIKGDEAVKQNRRYTITTTSGQYLRESMRTADDGDVYQVLAKAAEYIGEEATEPEHIDDDRIVLGVLTARLVREDGED